MNANRNSRIQLAVFWLLVVNSVRAQCPQSLCALRNSPCGRLSPGNADLPTFDLIREFHLDEHETHYEGVSVIPGSISSQRAYRLQSETNLTIHSVQAFPRGIPHQFSFESTFRTRLQPATPYYLFHVTNSYEASELSVTLDPIQQLIGIGLPDMGGNVQRVYFQHANLFDRSWHKVMLSVANDQATLWVDCIPVPGIRGEYFEPLLPRRAFDTSGGHIYLSRTMDETSYSSALLDLQWMVLSCDATRPTKQKCDELPQYQAATRPAEPSVVPPLPNNNEVRECPVQCPQGPPGRDGRDGVSSYGETGQKGEKGERGFQGESIFGAPGPVGLSGQKGERGERGEQGFDGQKGEPGNDGFPGLIGQKGEPGMVISRTEGESYSYGEVQIREICSKVLQEELAKLIPTLIGPIGPPGPPGKARAGRPGPKGEPGRNGFPGQNGDIGLQGEKGERGEDGISRVGPPGPPGPEGPAGLDIVGPPGPRGEEGRQGPQGPRGDRGQPGECPNDCFYTMQYMQQLQAAQAQQQQSKGPTPLNLNFKG